MTIKESKKQLIKKNQQFFTTISQSYDTRIFSSLMYFLQKHAIKEILNDKKSADSSFKLLDIGCGTGQLLSHLVEKLQNAKLYGIDLTKAMITLAKQKLRLHKNITVQQASVEKMPFKDETFDYVLTTEAFHHFPEPKQALLEMKRVLKDDGKIILIDINLGLGISYLFHKIEPGNKKIYSKKEFQQLFKETRLELLEQKRIGVIAIYNLVSKMNNEIKQNKNTINKISIMRLETAAFAGGCFWGVEEVFRTTKGIKETAVGYMGGKTKNPNYDAVCTDETGHAEAVQLQFDSKEISYEQLLDLFWNIHDPTTPNRQGPDAGSQYRSAIFYYSEEQKKSAEKIKQKLQNSKKFKDPIVTEIIAASQFYKAEEYHQKYLMKQGRNVCH